MSVIVGVLLPVTSEQLFSPVRMMQQHADRQHIQQTGRQTDRGRQTHTKNTICPHLFDKTAEKNGGDGVEA